MQKMQSELEEASKKISEIETGKKVEIFFFI